MFMWANSDNIDKLISLEELFTKEQTTNVNFTCPAGSEATELRSLNNKHDVEIQERRPAFAE